jgi:hypothetical protein
MVEDYGRRRPRQKKIRPRGRMVDRKLRRHDVTLACANLRGLFNPAENQIA